MAPKAVVAHQTDKRLRLKITSHRGDKSFFDVAVKKLRSAFKSCTFETNTLTGSILIVGDDIELCTIADYGRSADLFRLDAAETQSPTLALSATAPLHAADRRIQQVTSGRVDLPGAIFIALLVFGIIELIRGNWRTPPWYTAFWYAFGLYSKSLMDQSLGTKSIDAEADGE
jgi:hypothetical protein